MNPINKFKNWYIEEIKSNKDKNISACCLTSLGLASVGRVRLCRNPTISGLVSCYANANTTYKLFETFTQTAERINFEAHGAQKPEFTRPLTSEWYGFTRTK